jgi:hypothetical protein
VTVTDPLPSVFFGTRQRGQFCRVPAIMALGKDGSSGPHRQSPVPRTRLELLLGNKCEIEVF